ncbi:MAG: glutamate 5-kinase [Proteobacteria bacterium]|nr:glutamate 5-kinase [Pseudomonadota bacterium]
MSNQQLIVIKIGTSTIADVHGNINKDRISTYAQIVKTLKRQNYKIIIVSSGAIAAGRGRLGMKEKPGSIAAKQAVAAVGQNILMNIYEQCFASKGIVVGQILLTHTDIVQRDRCVNVQNTLKQLLFSYDVVPVINENDSVATEEIKFGDNDKLSALVAAIAGADRLIICSNIDGLYTNDPLKNKDARLISKVDKINDLILQLGKKTTSKIGTGGMQSKLVAAKLATASGVTVSIVNGLEPKNVISLLNGDDIGTTFVPAPIKLESKKCWIAYGTEVKGRLVLDDGAVEAIKMQNKSLLPVGIHRVEGSFSQGDTVELFNRDSGEVGRGIVRYNHQELLNIRGLSSKEILSMGKAAQEAVNRDDMVVWGDE